MERNKGESVVIFIAAVAFMCLAAPVSVPLSFTPLSVSLGSLAVMMTAMLMGWKRGAAVTVIYIILGCLGLPVFAGWQGGFSAITSANAGYIFGFILTAFITGLIVDRRQFSLWVYFLGGIAGTLALYIVGCFFLARSMGTTFSHAAVYGIVPFVLFDLVKIAFSSVLCWLMRSHIKLFMKLP